MYSCFRRFSDRVGSPDQRPLSRVVLGGFGWVGSNHLSELLTSFQLCHIVHALLRNTDGDNVDGKIGYLQVQMTDGITSVAVRQSSMRS